MSEKNGNFTFIQKLLKNQFIKTYKKNLKTTRTIDIKKKMSLQTSRTKNP